MIHPKFKQLQKTPFKTKKITTPSLFFSKTLHLFKNEKSTLPLRFYQKMKTITRPLQKNPPSRDLTHSPPRHKRRYPRRACCWAAFGWFRPTGSPWATYGSLSGAGRTPPGRCRPSARNLEKEIWKKWFFKNTLQLSKKLKDTGGGREEVSRLEKLKHV